MLENNFDHFTGTNINNMTKTQCTCVDYNNYPAFAYIESFGGKPQQENFILLSDLSFFKIKLIVSPYVSVEPFVGHNDLSLKVLQLVRL